MVKKRWKIRWRPLALLTLLAGLVGAGCSNAHISGGVGIHRTSDGNWGHSISVGIHGNGR